MDGNRQSIIIESEHLDQGTLFLGSLKAAQEENLLKRKIKALISAANDAQLKYSIDLDHLCLNVEDIDEENLIKYFDKCYNFIETNLQSTNVLVHCLAGVSRSVTIVIAYLMKKYSYKYEEAFEFVKERRSFIYPNEGFRQQLREYEKLLQQSKQ